MIHLNLLDETIFPVIHKMPAAEFGQRGVEYISDYIYEIEISPSLTLVLDEAQLAEIVACALDALPQADGPLDGEEWKEVAQ